MINYDKARKINDFNSDWLNKTIGEGRHSVIEWAEKNWPPTAHVFLYSGIWFDGIDLLTYKECYLKKREKPKNPNNLKIGWQIED